MGAQNIPKYVLGIIGTIVGLLLIWYFRDIVLYIILAVVITIIGSRLVNLITKIKIKERSVPNWLAALLALLVICSVGVAFFALCIPIIFSKISELATIDINSVLVSLETPIGRFEEFLSEYFAVNVSESTIRDTLSQMLAQFFNMSDINQFVSSIVSVVASVVIGIVSVIFISFFFLKDDKLFLNMILAITPTKYEGNVKHAMSSINNLLSRYLIGILCESTAMMIMVSIPLMICGFGGSTSFFIGIIIGVLNVIPYLGPWIGFAISVLIGVAFVSSGMSLWFIILSIGITVLAAQMIDNFLLQPLLYSNSVRAHPLEIFLVILMAGKIGGVFGMILAIPSYTVLRVIAKEFFNNFKVVRKLTEHL